MGLFQTIGKIRKGISQSFIFHWLKCCDITPACLTGTGKKVAQNSPAETTLEAYTTKASKEGEIGHSLSFVQETLYR